MNIIQQSIMPINAIAAGMTEPQGRRTGMAGVCTGSGCVPFECFNGKDVQHFIEKKSLGEYGFTVAKSVIQVVVGGLVLAGAVIGIGGPVGAVMVAAYEVLAPAATWLNFEINKRRLQEEQQKKLAQSANAVLNNITTFLEIRYPWCSAIEKIQANPAFADNSPVFGSGGPEMGLKFTGIYILAAAKLHNSRYGKTRQKILAVAPLAETLDEVHYVKGRLMVKVPNIEHYWRGDKITLDGRPGNIVVTHRTGNSKKVTWDCDRVFYDDDIVPANIFEKGRGCKVGFSWRYDGQANSLGGGKSGTNIRNMEGEGWLITSINYTDTHPSLVGKYVNVEKEFLVKDVPVEDPVGGNVPAINPSPDRLPDTNSEISPIKNTRAALTGNISLIIMIGIGIALLGGAISNARSNG
jgi:hypothetical protein